MAITDDFNRASLGSGWETALSAAWTITANAAVPTSSYANTVIRRGEGNFPANQYSQAKCQVLAPAGDLAKGGVGVRLDTTGNGYWLELGLGEVTLFRRLSGVNTYLSDGVHAAVSGTYYTLKLVVTGTGLLGYVNGVLKVSYDDPTTTILSGKPGLTARTGGIKPAFDDFECTDAVVEGGGGGGTVPRSGLLGVG